MDEQTTRCPCQGRRIHRRRVVAPTPFLCKSSIYHDRGLVVVATVLPLCSGVGRGERWLGKAAGGIVLGRGAMANRMEREEERGKTREKKIADMWAHHPW